MAICQYRNVCQVLPSSASSANAVTLPPPRKKPALRLCMSVLCPWGILIFMLDRQLIVFAILALHPFVEVLRGSGFVRVTAMELLKLIGTTYKVPCRVLSGVRVARRALYVNCALSIKGTTCLSSYKCAISCTTLLNAAVCRTLVDTIRYTL